MKAIAVEEWESYYDARYQSLKEKPASSSTPATANGFLSFFESLPSQCTMASSSEADEPFASEVDRWISHAPMPIRESSRNVCQWMRVNQTMYPRISFMAREFLAATSTSVPSECAFSAAGTTIDKRRARLGDDCVQAICELQSLLKFNTAM